MKDVKLTLTSQREIAEDTFEAILEGDVSHITAPGQFINIKLDGYFLRRPISVCDLGEGSVTIIYKVVGEGTKKIVKQIQLNGGTSADTESLFNFLADQLQDVEDLTYTITCSGDSEFIQLGTPFYVSVTGRCYLGGFWNFDIVPINIRSQGAGVSEHYWK